MGMGRLADRARCPGIRVARQVRYFCLWMPPTGRVYHCIATHETHPRGAPGIAAGGGDCFTVYHIGQVALRGWLLARIAGALLG